MDQELPKQVSTNCAAATLGVICPSASCSSNSCDIALNAGVRRALLMNSSSTCFHKHRRRCACLNPFMPPGWSFSRWARCCSTPSHTVVTGYALVGADVSVSESVEQSSTIGFQASPLASSWRAWRYSTLVCRAAVSRSPSA